ncbi:Cobalamin (vitamin B12) biosynthesis CobK/CbiJ, precorrin-6x reductase [Candidatus Magnetobacterium bavaricum]|uniref:Cobalamin (Vitamin B12) biosynthesis CobK/CbiJ, precorrin-6x reductase n=1 Tax=Candidatus Magnetobacterium bavaricum TaxID=29290 RepID=A0A0F3GUK9_9BACT|nr:Cobalamin (vitamin B12) biosynthesis CobK/CbiJ, precorrin-6x reductase [Candidatus Magnetobacterium bavaricum]
MEPFKPTLFETLSVHIREIFNRYSGFVFIMSLGIVNRVIAPLIGDKHTDPAVVTLDEAGRFAISTLSGHEGGANALATLVGSITGAQPVITTASEACRRYTCGVGCRAGASRQDILDAITKACISVGITGSDLRCIASAWVKRHEQGLLDAAGYLGLDCVFISREAIELYYLNNPSTYRSEMVFRAIGVYGIAQPCAMLTGRNTQLVLPRTVFNGVTVAIARECLFEDTLSPGDNVKGEGVVLVLGGTTEGISVARELELKGVGYYVSTATDYGYRLFKEKFGSRVVLENFTNDSLKRFITTHCITRVIDCTHPYAHVITSVAKAVCCELGVEYVSKIRETGMDSEFEYDRLVTVSSLAEAMDAIVRLSLKRPLFTTGSKYLSFLKDHLAMEGVEVFVRVLPFVQSLKSCSDAGVKSQNIIAMHGPFSYEINTALIRQYGIDCIVTKRSGKEGGFYEKVRAAVDCGITIVVVAAASG